MKIAIIGGSAGVGLALAQALAQRMIDTVVILPEAGAEGLEDLAALDAVFECRDQRLLSELPVLPLVMRELEPWPEAIKPHRNRYNRKGKWRQNQSGSKYF